MTLIVGGISGTSAWLVGDTAITAGTITERQREYIPKIERSQSGRFLIGYAGSAEYGASLARQAAQKREATHAIEFLRNASSDSHVSFLLAHMENPTSPRLLLIEEGKSTPRDQAHIGSHDAFNAFQRIRLGEIHPYAPEAFKQFMIGSTKNIPEILSEAIKVMIDLFVTRDEHDVGGWATPYLIDNEGVSFLGYVYAVSDPLFKQWAAGSIIPHGSAELGGATLSVTELRNQRGMVVYWLQRSGGLLMHRPEGSEQYQQFFFEGAPATFKANVEKHIEQEIDLWVSDQPAGPITKLYINRGINGNLESTIAFHGNAISFAVHNLTTPFANKSSINLEDKRESILDGLNITRLSDDELEIDFRGHKEILETHVVDALMQALAAERGNMRPEVPQQMKDVSCLAEVYPAWRADPSLHPALKGASLGFRHRGYGWQSFVLDPVEAKKLGLWLLGAF